MTEKKEKILNAALTLFAKEGYKATPTSKVAKLAGVSEGLIFRHFQNKEGLLEAILKEGEERAKLLFADIVLESEPKKVILKLLEISSKINQKEDGMNFWKLQYKIKWETERYGEHKMEPLQRALEAAFSKLGYSQPALEANILLLIMDGLATRFYLQESFDYDPMIQFLKTKYEL